MSTIIHASSRSIGRKVRFSLRKYLAVLRVSIANNLAYLPEVFFRALLLVVLVFILTQLWKTTFSARPATTCCTTFPSTWENAWCA